MVSVIAVVMLVKTIIMDGMHSAEMSCGVDIHYLIQIANTIHILIMIFFIYK